MALHGVKERLHYHRVTLFRSIVQGCLGVATGGIEDPVVVASSTFTQEYQRPAVAR